MWNEKPILMSAIKRSSVHHVQAHHHARFAEKHGWEIAVAYDDPAAERKAIQESVALVDQSWLGKLECKGEWVAGLEGKSVDGATFRKLIATHGTWITKPDAVEAAEKTLESARAGKAKSYLINNSAAYASFDLIGPRAADIVCKLSSVQVAEGGHTQAMVAAVHCLVIRDGRGFQFHFGREFGEYMWECFLDAGMEFGIRPAGVDAIG